MPRHLFLICATVCLLGASVVAGGQAPVPSTLTLDVWVRDSQGQPVGTLAPGDFVVQVEGQQRRVTAARFVDAAVDVASGPGRAIALVLDDLSFQGDQAAPLSEAASRWLASLHASDRLAIVRSTLSNERVAATDPAEAATTVRSTPARTPATPPASDFQFQRRALHQADTIARAISWLAAQPGPRVLVVVSLNLAMPPAAARYLSASYRIARDAGISSYVVSPDATAASSPQTGPAASWSSTSANTSATSTAGVDQFLAGLGGRVVSHAAGGDAFAAIARAVSGFYRLEVELPSATALPRSVPVTMSVRPAGLAVRTSAFGIAPTATSTPRTAPDRTRDILAGVDLAADVAIDAATFLTRDPASADQLLLTVSLVMPQELPSPVRVSFGLLDETGTVRFGSIDVPEATSGPRRTSVSIPVAPGWHRLTLVAEDGTERLGSLSRPVHGRLQSMGGYAVAEPRVLWRADNDQWQVLGGESVPESAVVVASVFELYPDAPGRQPPQLPLRLADQSGRELATQMLTPVAVGQAWRLSSEVRLDGLSPGEYVFTLDTTRLDAAAEPLSLRVRKVSSASTATTARAPAPPPLPAAADIVNLFRAGVRDNWPRFAREDLLLPDLLRPQLKAVAGSRPLPAALATATGDAWWASLRTTATQATALGRAARGLIAIHDGDARTGETLLRDAAGDNPTSTALRRLLGLAYAASGRDDAAAGVWNLAVNARTDDPRWTLAFVEALGRVGDFTAALDLLRRMPGDPVGPRLERTVDTLVVMGLMDEATTALAAWETGDGRQQSAARLTFYLVALRYVAALHRPTDAGAADDFRRVAERYVSAGGEYANVVAPWIQSAAVLPRR